MSIGQKVGIGLGMGLSVMGLLIIAVVVLKLKRRKRGLVAQRAEVKEPEAPCVELPATEARWELAGKAADPRALRPELEGATNKVIYGEDPVSKVRDTGSVADDDK
ncbi:hypothetical protein IMZ48_43545 [Candidatus Bathyarchaeota archaeon]|nr:hypothetical protein [Candidatus Bathyarchaeota archaeon]